jgi:hypothetical protein
MRLRAIAVVAIAPLWHVGAGFPAPLASTFQALQQAAVQPTALRDTLSTVVFAQSQAPGGRGTPPPVPGGSAVGRGNAPEPAGTAIIRGRVTAADTGLPLSRAQVRVIGGGAGAGREPKIAVTDDQGRYELTALPAGRLTLNAQRTGYVTIAYGQRRPREAGRPIDIGTGQTIERVDFSLPRAGSIIARIVDDLGDPLAGASVEAMILRYTNGRRTLGPAGVGSRQTDDLGEARITGLMPGDYYVTVSTDSRAVVLDTNDSRRRYVTTFFPGTSSEGEAQPVRVTVGQDATVAFAITAARTATVSGVVRQADGTSPRGLTAGLNQDSALRTTNRSSPIQADGSFLIGDVVPGEYTIVVRPNSGAVLLNGIPVSDAPDYGRLPITVRDADLSGLVVNMTKTMTLRGRVTFDTGAPPANLSADALTVIIDLAVAPAISAGRPKMNDDWTFEIANVAASGTIRLRPAPAPAEWFVKAVLIDGKDVTDRRMEFLSDGELKDIEVVVTQKRSGVSGGIVDGRNVQVTEAFAVVFPEDQALWTGQSRFISTARPDQAGRFVVTGLPPGRYFVAAVDSLEAGEERDPSLLERLARTAVRVTLAESETRNVNLRLVP